MNSYLLHSIYLNSGDIINFESKILSNQQWFSITQQSVYSSSSYYDGPDYNRALEIYKDIILAFKGVKKAELLEKELPNMDNVFKLLKEEKRKHIDLYQSLKRNPLFLGITDF